MQSISRRHFLKTSTAAGIGLATLHPGRAAAVSPNGKLRVLSIGVVGTIGEADRKAVASHPQAEIAGLCDVDSDYLARASKDHPAAFTCRDYRDAFANHVDKFDAVIVSVPDHSHAPILLTAMSHGKHVYGQKPLVHQLEELVMVENAVKARPHLVTQLGNQRMANPGRRAAVEILRQGQLGKAIEAYAWVGPPGKNDGYFNYDRILAAPSSPPPNLDWNLWLGPCAEMPYRDKIAPTMWRSYWEFGSNGLGDWGCHVLDVIFFSYEELQSAASVRTDCPESTDKVFHTHPCRATITYRVQSSHFSSERFPIHYYDSDQRPTAEQLRIPEVPKDSNMTAVVCEGGTLTLEAEGRLKIWRDGRAEEGLRMPGLPKKFEPLNHWHAWVDNCLGKKTELRTPFKDAVRITEAALLAVKATRFPGQTLDWDRPNLAFPNHPEATRTLVRREYRDGFAPPKMA